MQRNTHFTAIVVGGGPAGSAAAQTLVAHGIETCIIDKCEFPRDKLCGGLLTLRSKKIFENVFHQKWDEVIDRTCHGVKFFYKNKLLSEVTNYSSLFFTQRFAFDNFLLGIARNCGANALLNTTVKAINVGANSVDFADGTAMTYEYLVGADGINSAVARSLFGTAYNPNTVGFGLEVDVPEEEVPNSPLAPEIHFGAARWGYGWVFPKKGAATLGLGGLHKCNSDLKYQFRDFLKARCEHLPNARVRGHFLPFGGTEGGPVKITSCLLETRRA